MGPGVRGRRGAGERGVGPAAAPLDRGEPVEPLGRDQFLSGRPFERSADALDLLVDGLVTPTHRDEPFPDRLQSQRAELRGQGIAVQFAGVAAYHLDVLDFTGSASRPVRGSADSCVPGTRLWSVVGTRHQLLVALAELVGPNGMGAAGLLVGKVRRGWIASSTHGTSSSSRTVERFHSSHGLESAPSTCWGKRETLRPKGFSSRAGDGT